MHAETCMVQQGHHCSDSGTTTASADRSVERSADYAGVLAEAVRHIASGSARHFNYPSDPLRGPARPAIKDALRACPAGSPVGSHVAYKQLCCLLHGNVLTRGAEYAGGLTGLSAGKPGKQPTGLFPVSGFTRSRDCITRARPSDPTPAGRSRAPRAPSGTPAAAAPSAPPPRTRTR